ncbi:hypothetical protein JCM19231_1585 [Vibrio ishigakensis]|uniref:Uncharacterized protein n=1 Tax=Vibrio ishigakensis TaxID=1481914 RepID=A0A0B8P792_9VIBR|nr:hypothetical protein JCM19231_1585 [Vibrio ishigakensis]
MGTHPYLSLRLIIRVRNTKQLFDRGFAPPSIVLNDVIKFIDGHYDFSLFGTRLHRAERVHLIKNELKQQEQ